MKRQYGTATVAALCLVLLHGCKAEDRSRAPSACLVDEIGPIKTGWTERTDCTANDDSCKAECFAGDGNACLNHGFALQSKSGDDTATGFFERACRLGVSLGCTNWAGHLWAHGSKSTNACMKRMFDKACRVGDTMSCAMVARVLIEIPQTPFDPALGAARLLRDCAADGGPPCRMLALYLEGGLVGPKTNALSPMLLREACDGGDEVACGDHATARELSH